MVENKGLIVSEIFGPTVQGEGPSLGKRCMFLRLAICNLACSWCDTKYTWDWKNYNYKEQTKRMSAEAILDHFHWFPPDINRLVITGGEPLLQEEKLYPIIRGLYEDAWSIEIETAGTISPKFLIPYVEQFNVSPKLEHSGNPLEKRFKPDVLKEFVDSGVATFKFVVQETEDLKEVAWICGQVGIPSEKVYIMPEGTNPERLNRVLSNIIEPAIQCGYNVTTRMHVMAWGEKRGV
jgi:7-cyano-7-deazaguanosine (preQ0) biosynthesis protein QueE